MEVHRRIISSRTSNSSEVFTEIQDQISPQKHNNVNDLDATLEQSHISDPFENSAESTARRANLHEPFAQKRGTEELRTDEKTSRNYRFPRAIFNTQNVVLSKDIQQKKLYTRNGQINFFPEIFVGTLVDVYL
jgi:hypothetical protein